MAPACLPLAPSLIILTVHLKIFLLLCGAYGNPEMIAYLIKKIILLYRFII
jgi:hypothetical protein